MITFFLQPVARFTGVEDRLSLDLLRHEPTGTLIAHLSENDFWNPQTDSKSLQEALALALEISPAKRLVLDIGNMSLSTHDLVAISRSLQFARREHVKACVVISPRVGPEFVRHHIMLSSPAFARTVHEAILTLVPPPLCVARAA